MRIRSGRAMAVVMTFAATTLAACETPLGPADPAGDTLSGEWSACLNDGAADYSRQMLFYADSFSTETRTYATSDGTCTGAETSASREIWRYRLAGSVPAQIGGTGPEVLAREINIENSFESLFTIVYVDDVSIPALLYFGDLSLDPLQDGTAPDKRPQLLSPASALVAE